MFGVPMGGFNPSFNPELYEKEFYIGMGESTEILAKDLDISREDQEAFAVKSHEKALAAIAAGRYDNEIIPAQVNGVEVSKDEGPRTPDLDKIKSLDPAFDSEGTITAATSSPISIGAAAALIMGGDKAKELGLSPKFKIKSRAVAGVEWTRMGSGPLPATEKVLAKAGLQLSDIDAIELNEAFAAQSLYVIKSRAVAGVEWTRMGSGPLPATEKALNKAGLQLSDIDAIELNEAFAAQSLYVIRKGAWDMDKINLNGGAIALGHPLGCSGVRLLVTLMNVMEQNDSTLGLATMCIGSGQGIATVIERV